VGNLTTGSALNSFQYNLNGPNITQKAITLPNGFGTVSFNLGASVADTLTATGDFNFGNNEVIIYNAGVTGTPTNYLDMATSTLTCGTLLLGSVANNGYLKFGSSALHSIGVFQRNGTGTGNILDMGSSTITSSGNVNFTGINVTPGTSTLVLAGTSAGGQITPAGNTLYNLIQSR